MGNSFFQFSSSQKKGLWLLIILIITFLLSWQLFKYLYKEELSQKQQVQILDIPNEGSAVINVQQAEDNTSNNYTYSYQDKYEGDAALSSIPYHPQQFNPNTASLETMIATGVPIGSAKRIIKYRNKGGIFYEKEKLKNFGLSPEEYQRVAPYISISERRKQYNNNYTNTFDRSDNSTDYRKYTPKEEPSNLDLNSATQEELMLFKGIGPGYSKRIIEYRERLGGYLSVSQLKEVYGLPDSTYMHIKDKLVIVEGKVKRININTASQEALAAHPYIRKFMAEQIVKFRNDIKKFNTLQELRQIPLINEEKYRKIVPYIYIE